MSMHFNALYIYSYLHMCVICVHTILDVFIIIYLSMLLYLMLYPIIYIALQYITLTFNIYIYYYYLLLLHIIITYYYITLQSSLKHHNLEAAEV